MLKRMGYFLNYSVQNFLSTENNITQFPDGLRLNFLFRMFIVVINEEEILRLIF